MGLQETSRSLVLQAGAGGQVLRLLAHVPLRRPGESTVASSDATCEREPALKADWLMWCMLAGGGSRAVGPLAVLAETQFQLPVLVRPYSDTVLIRLRN